MEKIISILTKNILWKIMALIMATILWILAINIEDPIESKSYYPIALELRNLDVLEQYGLVLLNQREVEGKSISVRVEANNKLLSTQLTNGNVKAYIDLSPVSFSFMDKVGEVLTPPVQVELPSFAETARRFVPTPTTVGIILDKLVSEEFPITVVKTAEPNESYVPMDPVITPATVKITGAKSIVDTVHTVRIDVDLTNVSTDYKIYGPIVVYDHDNKDITSQLSLDIKEAEVFVPVNKFNQIPIILPVINGFPADGYTITSVETDINYIEVVGKEEDISALNGIRLAPIDITGASETIVVKRNVTDFLSSVNLSVNSDKPSEVNITIVLEREAIKEFNIPIGNIEILGEYNDISYDGGISVRLMGLERIISLLEEDSITGKIDLTRLTPGEHNVVVNLNLPEGISVIGGEPIAKIDIASTNTSQSASSNEDESQYPDSETSQEVKPEDAESEESGG